jgi:hypothetical protein
MLPLVPSCASTAGRQPSLTYYEVLDISPDEQDPKIIEEAALRCSGHVRTYQLTREAECTLWMNEIAQALNTLLDPVRRRDYDLGLSKPSSPAVSECGPPDSRDPAVMRRGKSASPTRGEDSRVLLIVEGRTCDVQLLYRRRALRKAGR